MPQEPKKRHSRARQGKGRASIHLNLPQLSTCPNCNTKISFHTVCSKCGHYKGQKVVAEKTKKPKS